MARNLTADLAPLASDVPCSRYDVGGGVSVFHLKLLAFEPQHVPIEVL